jgi:outer membrane receptor protein involved in Fe transport
MPKIGTSWVLSDAPFFPKTNFVDALRVRVAYGQSGTPPGPADKLRVYRPETIWWNGTTYSGFSIASYGNTKLRPERSVGTELGFDADLLDGRVSGGITWYHKVTRDALLPVQIAPSVLGGAARGIGGVSGCLPACPQAPVTQPVVNLGRVQNDGIEAILDVTPVRTRIVNWQSSLTYSHNQNILKKLNAEAAFLNLLESSVRYVEGYPLGGRWNYPMASYADVNLDGMISPDEIQLSDSAVFQGGKDPKYEAGWTNTVGLFNGTLLLSAQLTYTNGQAQVNDLMRRTWVLSRAMNDPTTPLATQAAWRLIDTYTEAAGVNEYAITQTVSTLRFNSLSIRYLLPRVIVARLHAQSAALSLQGSNLGLRSNYTGLDPNLNVLVNELNGVRDAGTLPPPKTWRLEASLSY